MPKDTTLQESLRQFEVLWTDWDRKYKGTTTKGMDFYIKELITKAYNAGKQERNQEILEIIRTMKKREDFYCDECRSDETQEIPFCSHNSALSDLSSRLSKLK